MRHNRRAGGFTLIELLITIAVLVILVGVGYPMYTTQLLKAHRVDARSGVMKLALAQERYFVVNSSYGTAAQLDALDNGYTQALSDLNHDATPGPDYYTFTIVVPAGAAINRMIGGMA